MKFCTLFWFVPMKMLFLNLLNGLIFHSVITSDQDCLCASFFIVRKVPLICVHEHKFIDGIFLWRQKQTTEKKNFKLILGFNLIICLKKRRKVWWNNSNSVNLKHPRSVECAPYPLLVPCPPAAPQMCLPNPQTLICIQSIQEVISLMVLLFLQLPFWRGV